MKIFKIDKVQFIFSPFKGVETASLGVFVKAGARYEHQNFKGIAHFLEHMVFKGSKNYSHKEIKREIEGRGGLLNAFTSQEFTGFYAHFLKKNIKVVLDILLDMLFFPLLKEEDIERERGVILEEIKMYNDLPSSRAGALLDKLLWPGHPLGEDVIGTFDSVRRINREALFSFKNYFYRPENMLISCSGDFSFEEIYSLGSAVLKHHFNGKSKLKNPLNIAIKKILPPLSLKSKAYFLEKKELEQTHLCLGFRAVSYNHQERFTAELLHVVMGANMSSRLFEVVREKKGLCYEISTEIRKYKDSGAFSVHMGLDSKKVTFALKCVLAELKKIKEKKIGRQELNRSKDYFLGQLAMNLERPQGKMFFVADTYLTLGRVYSFSEIQRQIEEITPPRIKNCARKILCFSKICLSCVGNFDNSLKNKITLILRKFS